MPEAPRVSIITPSYNQAAFLEETIQSVFAQEYPDLEYFIIDGGSTDGSVELIQRYADRLAGWVSEKDRGQAEAINKGFARATGEIVAWINSDDYYLPGALREAVGALTAHPECGMVFGDVVSIDGAGTPINVMTYGDWGLDELMQFNIIGQPAVFLRRAVLEQAGGLDLAYHYLLDHQLWLRVAQLAPVRYLPRRWAAARFHAGAKNVAQAAGFGREAVRIARWMAEEPGLAERYRRLRRRIWAGAHRMDGRYLLDGGLPGPALLAYLRSLACYPPIALPEARRMLFAFASLFGDVSWLRRRYLQNRKDRLKLS
jgi:glycosyltransferase involved in cell wall biosynthesis